MYSDNSKQDYKAFIYTMPGQFGSIKRCAIYRDSDSFRRNLNLYVLSENSSGKLTTTNTTIKENIKTWLNTKRMINDSVDILDAKVLWLDIVYPIIEYYPQDELVITSSADLDYEKGVPMLKA